MRILIIFLAILSQNTIAQSVLKGEVLEENQGKLSPLPGANVYWLNTTIGTVTNEEGKFNIAFKNNYKKLIISYIGYKTDTITLSKNNYLKHVLKPTEALNSVTVTSKKQSTFKSYTKAENVFTVSSDELLKAACCNLSESFETNPTIDVNFSDAVTGSKQIKMLGLASPYILISTENIPSVRGASQTYGLSFIPGTWVESIQITKGAGSVINGFESITGQINTELVKPSNNDNLFINLYAATSSRLELNTHLNTKVSNTWHTGLYVHGNTQQQKHDVNNDNFLDMPLSRQLNIMNRWQYTNPKKGLVSFTTINYLNDEKQNGELNFNPNTDIGTTNAWGSEINTERFNITTKFGYVNPELTYQSLGFQTAFSYHKQDSYFGLNNYDITHQSFYSNIIYNSIISDSRHKIKTGVNFTFDKYNETVNTINYNRIENSVGGFFEYAYDSLDKLTLTAGVRADIHNRFGFFITPRLHLRYTPWEKSAWRFSIGRGIRSANIFAENQNLFASSREITVENSGGKIYGLNPEIAWNYGVSYLQGFKLNKRHGDITFDFYRTDFKNQVVVDWENPFQINFYNLNGSSYANSFQTEVNYNLFNNFDLRLAYKYYDVQIDYKSGQLKQPFVPNHRFFANTEYKTKMKDNGNRWKFDATFNWIGEQRFPNTSLSAQQYQLPNYSPTVSTLNMQITKVFSPKFEVYLGGENITNVRQPNPIISAENPFGSNFDSNFVYGPIFGSLYYAGLRFKIN